MARLAHGILLFLFCFLLFSCCEDALKQLSALLHEGTKLVVRQLERGLWFGRLGF